MRGLFVLFFLAASSLLVAPACDQEDAEQRLVWARERMHPNASLAQLRDVLNWLRISTSSCPLYGDMWYYRSLVEDR